MNNIIRIICVLALGVPVLSKEKKTINLALETSVLFEPQDTQKHMELINDARRFLDILEHAIMPKKALRQDTPKQSLTDFISRLAETILQLYEEDLETFFKVLESEMKSHFLKGSIFRDIVYDPKLQTFFRNKLKEWANTDPRQMKAKLRKYMAREANGNDTLHELGRFLNDYYGREQEFKMDEIIKRLKRTLDESEISIIIRDALNTLVLQHYDKMNYTTRAKLVEKINTIKHEYFASHVDHDLMLTFRGQRTKPQESSYFDYEDSRELDAWLHELEKKGATYTDEDLSDVNVHDTAEDKEASILTLDDWDTWLSKRNMKGYRKINTLMSDGIEEMIKEDPKLKNKRKYKPNKVRAGDHGNYESIYEPGRVKAARHFQLRKTVIDKSIDETDIDKRSNEIDESTKELRNEPQRVKTTPDYKLGSHENDESTDKPEKIKTTADFTSTSNENDKYIHKLKKSITSGFKIRNHDFDVSKAKKLEKLIRSGFKFRKRDFDVSKDEPERVKTTVGSKSGSNENDEYTDKSKNIKTTAGSKLERKGNGGMNIDLLERVNTTADSKLRTKGNGMNVDELETVNTTADSKHERPKKVKTKDFKSKHKHRHRKRKHKPLKFNARFLLGNEDNKESKDQLKKDKDTADYRMRNNRDEEHVTGTFTRNKRLTTVDVFGQLYGIKPNKELIIDKDLQIFVGGFDASLVGKDKKNKLRLR